MIEKANLISRKKCFSVELVVVFSRYRSSENVRSRVRLEHSCGEARFHGGLLERVEACTFLPMGNGRRWTSVLQPGRMEFSLRFVGFRTGAESCRKNRFDVVVISVAEGNLWIYFQRNIPA